MKVKVIKASLPTYWYTDKIGEVFEAVELLTHPFGYRIYNSGLKYFDKNDVIEIKEKDVNTFTKDMLKSGMRVVTRDGWTSIYMGEVFAGDASYLYLNSLNDELKVEGLSSCDIIEVYAAPTAPKLLDPAITGELLWKREEKSPEQKELDTLMDKIKELTTQAEKLQDLINK